VKEALRLPKNVKQMIASQTTMAQIDCQKVVARVDWGGCAHIK
jgi:hypothetical protein